MEMKWVQPAQTVLPRLFRRIPRTAKVAFATSFIAGFLTYLFALTNPLIAVDDALTNVISMSNQVALGRWSSAWMGALSTWLEMPLVNGIIMLLAVAFLSAIVVTYLDIRSSFLAAAVALVMTCYPAVGQTLKFTFLASGYMIAAMLCVLGLYLLDRYRFGWIAGVPLIALGLGTYQAYISLVIALMFVRGVQLLLDPETQRKALLIKALRYVLTVVAALALYYALTGFFSKYYGLPLLSYQSVDSMGKMSLATVAKNFLRSYGDFKREITYLSLRPYFYVSGYPNYLIICMTLGLIGVNWISLQKKNAFETLWLAALLLLAPFLLCSIRIFNPEKIYSLMTYSVAGLYLLGLSMMDRIPQMIRRLHEQPSAIRKVNIRKILRVTLIAISWLMILCLIVCLYGWTVGIIDSLSKQLTC